MSWATFGFEATKNILEKQLNSGKLVQAYLFCGPEGIGKKTLALELAKKILKTENLSNHPDFQMLAEQGEISVERVRQFIGALNYKPFLAEKKVAIIDSAQNLNSQSGNALLKTLEEPSSSTILILVASSSRLLPTIVSRCQVFRLNSFSTAQLEKFAATQGLKTDQEILALSAGSIARLLGLSGKGAELAEEKQAIARFESLKNSSRAEKFLAISEFGSLEIEELTQLFKQWFFWQASELKKHPQSFFQLKALGEAINSLRGNKNKKLILQGLMQRI